MTVAMLRTMFVVVFGFALPMISLAGITALLVAGEIPWLAEAAQREDLGQYLDLSALDRASSTSPAVGHPAG